MQNPLSPHIPAPGFASSTCLCMQFPPCSTSVWLTVTHNSLLWIKRPCAACLAKLSLVRPQLGESSRLLNFLITSMYYSNSDSSVFDLFMCHKPCCLVKWTSLREGGSKSRDSVPPWGTGEMEKGPTVEKGSQHWEVQCTAKWDTGMPIKVEIGREHK